MAAISDYADLLVAVSDYIGRDDFAGVFDRLVGLAEDKLNRRLRTSYQEETTTLTPDINGEASLPADFVDVREAFLADQQYARLQGMSPAAIRTYYGAIGGAPRRYAVSGRTFIVRPIGQNAVTLNYYASIPPLASNPSNWLITEASDVYLWAVTLEAAIWAKNAEAIQAAKALADDAIAGLSNRDGRALWSNARVQVMGPTP